MSRLFLKNIIAVICAALSVIAISCDVASSDDNAVWSGAGIGSGIFWTINMRPASARSGGAGSSYAAFSGGAARNRDFENNPSVLAAPDSGRGVDLVIARWFDDLYFNGIFASIPSQDILKSSVLGFSLKRFATEDFLTDARGFGTDRFQYEDISIGGAFAFNIGRGKYAGVGIRYMGEKIYNLAGSGMAFDWGFASRITDDISGGVSLLDFPGFIKYNSGYEGNLKSNLKVSLAYEPFLSWGGYMRARFFADVNNYFVSSPSWLFEHEIAVGLEVEPYNFVSIGGGVRGFPSGGIADLKFSFGIGFSLKDKYRIDYAGEILPLGDVHRLGVSVSF